MNKLGFLLLLVLAQTGCSIKSKEPIHQHSGKVQETVILEKKSDDKNYKKKIDTQAIYKISTDKSKDLYADTVKPLSEIVLNPEHLDDPSLYNGEELKYALQIFQTHFLYLLQKQPEKVVEIIKKYETFLNYKCTTNAFSDCRSHAFLKQDSNTSGILLSILKNQSGLDKKIIFLKLSLAFQNTGNGDAIKQQGIQVLYDYLKAKIYIKKVNGADQLQFKDTNESNVQNFRKDIAFFTIFLRTFNLLDNDLDSVSNFIIYANSPDILGQELYDFLFVTSAQKNIDMKQTNSKAFLKQWTKMVDASERSNPYSWSNLKPKLPNGLNISNMTLGDLKKQGLAALIIYQTAQDLSSQKSLKDLEKRKQFILQNPDLAFQIFETQLKMIFFSLVGKSFKVAKGVLDEITARSANPQELLDLIVQDENSNLQPIWMGFEKVISHFANYFIEIFGSTSKIGQKFRILQDNIVISNKVYVSTPMMFMVLYYLESQRYKEKLRVMGTSGSSIELDAPLLMSEVLQARLSSFFYLNKEDKDLNLNQYQIIYSLAVTVLMDVPQIFGYDKSTFIQSFIKSNLKVPIEKLDDLEKYYEKIGFGNFDLNHKYANKNGDVHRVLSICENPQSAMLPISLKNLRERTFMGSLDGMNHFNTEYSAFNRLAIYYGDKDLKDSIDEGLEVIRSDLDPVIDLVSLIEKISKVSYPEKTNLKLRRDRLLERIVELEQKAVRCGIKLNKIEKDRQESFFRAQNNYVKNIIAISYWIDSQTESNELPFSFKNKNIDDKEKRIEFAQNWLMDTIYQPLKYKSPGLFEELKNYKFFELSSVDQSLLLNARNLDTYYRLALWLEEPDQQKKASVNIAYEENYQRLREQFFSNDYSGIFKSRSVAFKPNDPFLERTLRQNIVKDFYGWNAGNAYQMSMRNVLKQEIARWKMSTSSKWDYSNWMTCQNECLEKRKEQSQQDLKKAIQINLDFASLFQIKDEDIQNLRALGIYSNLNRISQIEGTVFLNTSPDYFLTYTVSTSGTGVNNIVYLGTLDHFFRYATSFLLGANPLYSLADQYFADSGRESQNSQFAEAEATTVDLKAKDLYSRRIISLDIHSEKGAADKYRVVELSLLGQSLNRTQEDQFLSPIDKELDKNIRHYVVAPTVRELELRQVLLDTINKMEKEWEKPKPFYTMLQPPSDKAWLVSSSYISRIEEQQKEFHRLTKGVFELNKWFGSENKTAK